METLIRKQSTCGKQTISKHFVNEAKPTYLYYDYGTVVHAAIDVSLAVPNPQDPMMFLFASLLTTVNKIMGVEGAFLLQATQAAIHPGCNGRSGSYNYKTY